MIDQPTIQKPVLPKKTLIIAGIILVIAVISGLLIYFKPWKKVTNVVNNPPGSTIAYENDVLTFDNFTPDSTIKSPFQIKGTISGRWMSEGQFTIALLDENKKYITSVIAKETEPGSWLTTGKAPFSAELNFATDAKDGYLQVLGANPGGLEENKQEQIFPVKINSKSVAVSNNPKLDGEWDSYSDAELGIEFKFPRSDKNQINEVGENEHVVIVDDNITFTSNKFSMKNCQTDCPKILNSKPVSVGNLTFTQYILEPTFEGDLSGVSKPLIYSYEIELRNGYIGHFSAVVSNRNNFKSINDAEKQMNTILSTFSKVE